MPVRERPIVAEEGGVDRRVGVALTAAFLVMIGFVAPVQLTWEFATGARPQEFDIFRSWPTLERIEGYEDALAESSVVAKLARPVTQLATLSAIGQGNEKVAVGRDGWLFYRPGILYPTGPGFRSEYVRAESKVREWDPLPAILEFRDALAERGIDLVVVPIPVKPQIYPEKLSRLYDASKGPPVNPYHAEFVRKLDESGVGVMDPTRSMWEAKGRGELFQPLDTHWTPLGLSVFADALVGELLARYPYLEGRTRGYRVERTPVTNRGDVFDMLDLPEWSSRFAERTVEIERVLDESTGEAARPDPDAEVVLLGDSFSNIYSLAEMGWGEHAGLGEQMMLRLGRPLDVIAVNGGAPTATRAALARDRDLSRKRLVVWSFATRELITYDSKWAVVPLPEPGQRPVTAAGAIEIVAEVLVASTPPRPGVDPYRNALTFTKYGVRHVVAGEYGEAELLAVEWVMRELVLTPAARRRPGDVLRLRLVPFEGKKRAEPAIGKVRALDDTGDYDHAPYWVESAAPADM